MTYRVVFSEAAALDLEQLFDFALQRELDSETGDLDIPQRALQAIKDSLVWPPERTCRDLAGLEILMGFRQQKPFSQPTQS